MTKVDFVKTLSEKTNLSKVNVTAVLEAISEIAAATLQTEGKFTLPDMAQFRVVATPARAARTGRNPKTGEPVAIAAKPAASKLKVKPVGAFQTASTTKD